MPTEPSVAGLLKAQERVHGAENVAACWAAESEDADEIATMIGSVREFLDALPIELEKARQRWEQEVRERLEALDWQAINSAAEAQCPSRDHRPLACAQCVTDAALSAIFGEAEPVEGER